MRYTYAKQNIPEGLKEKLPYIPPICIDILYKRGYRTESEIMNFLIPDTKELTNNLSFLDTDKACERIYQAILNKEEMVVYQDYDADGCCAAAILMECVQKLGGIIHPYVNSREVDGYGACKNGIDVIGKMYPNTSLIITVDNGIVAYDAIQYANKKGFCVIVTDHHEPGETLPDAYAIVNPKRHDETYPFRDFCGAGVVFKLMLHLCAMMKADMDIALSTLDIAALATVADVVSLTGENRVIVKEGLAMMEEENRFFFSEMRRIAIVSHINAHHTLGFIYGPMVNSLCRMGKNPLIATNAMISDNPVEVTTAVQQMKDTNDARKEETELELQVSLELVKQRMASSLIVQDDSFQEGIIGIVAGRIKSEYNRPVMVFAKNNNGVLKGSCRSIPEVDLKKLLDEVNERGLILGYGGHKLAAGLSVKAENFEAFCAAVIEITDRLLADYDFDVEQELDAVVHSKDLSVETVQYMKMLEPFGQGFTKPLLGLTTECDSVKFMGENQKHVKYIDSKNNISVIRWNAGEAVRAKGSAIRRKFIGYPELNYFRDTVAVQFFSVDSPTGVVCLRPL